MALTQFVPLASQRSALVAPTAARLASIDNLRTLSTTGWTWHPSSGLSPRLSRSI